VTAKTVKYCRFNQLLPAKVYPHEGDAIRIVAHSRVATIVENDEEEVMDDGQSLMGDTQTLADDSQSLADTLFEPARSQLEIVTMSPPPSDDEAEDLAVFEEIKFGLLFQIQPPMNV